MQNVTKQAKRATKAVLVLTPAQHTVQCVTCFAQFVTADGALQNAKALWDAARAELRIALALAHKQIPAGKAWDAFKADTRAAIVKAKVCATVEEAGRVINNALIALKITGNGAKKGGKKGKGGRPEVTATGEATTVDAGALNLAALAYIRTAQEKHVGDDEVLDMLGELAAILAGQ